MDQAGQLVVGVEADLQGWTVGEMRYTAVTGDFLTAHSKWGLVDLWAARLRCRSYSALCGGWRRVRLDRDLHPLTGIAIGGDGAREVGRVGAGIDYGFTNNWFAGVDVLHSQYEVKPFAYPIPILNLGFVGFKKS